MTMAAMRVALGIVYVALLGGVTAKTSSVGFANATSHVTTAPASAASGCCFAVLDTIDELFWNIVMTRTFNQVVNLTSYTTYVTPYPNSTTHTNIDTNVYTVNATLTATDSQAGRNPITLYSNSAATPSQISTLLNGSQTVTGGVTVNSPAAFWAYSTLKIITAPAVTNSKGQHVCATVSSFPSVKTLVSEIFTGVPISTDVETYVTDEIEYTTVRSSLLEAISTIPETVTDKYTLSSQIVRTGGKYTTTLTDVATFTVNPYVESYFNDPTKTSGSIVSLATPYIYLPPRGALGGTGEDNVTCDQPNGPENYGYPMQQLLDFAAKEHPEIASCLPGGPYVSSNTECTGVAPVTEDPGGDLTSSTVIVVTPPGQSPTQPAVGPTTPQAPPPPPPSTPAAPPPPPPSTPAAPPPPPPQTQPAPPNNSPPPNTQPTPPNNSPPPPTNSQPAVPPPMDGPPPNNPVPNPSSPDPTPISPANPNPANPNPIGSAIVSIIGNAPIPATPGAPDYVVSVQATVPVVPGQPAPTGVTTVINGVTEVIVSSATTIPASALSNLGGSTTIISGTLNVVVGTPGVTTSVPINSQLPGLTGKTTVVGSSTWVILTGAETIPVVVGSKTAGPPSSTGTSAPLQASGASRGMFGFGAIALAFIAAALAL